MKEQINEQMIAEGSKLPASKESLVAPGLTSKLDSPGVAAPWLSAWPGEALCGLA